MAHVAVDAVRVAAEGSRDVIERAALPVVLGSEIEVRIDEVHAYNRRDGVGRLEGYPVCVAGAAELVGHHVRVVIDEAARYFAVGAPGRRGRRRSRDARRAERSPDGWSPAEGLAILLRSRPLAVAWAPSRRPPTFAGAASFGREREGRGNVRHREGRREAVPR